VAADPKRTAAVLIEYQNDFTDPMFSDVRTSEAFTDELQAAAGVSG
jgi:hypothetical protein